MGLKENIRLLLKENNLSARELEKQLGLGHGYISKLGHGNPNLKTIHRIANYFCVPLKDIIGEDEVYITEEDKPQGIPLLGVVRAGVPTECPENILDYIQADYKNPEEYFALMVKGDSMQPRMFEGDIVIVHSQPDAENGELVVAKVNGDEACVKKLLKFSHGIALQSLNPAYPLLQFSEEQIASLPVTIMGKVKELRARL